MVHHQSYLRGSRFLLGLRQYNLPLSTRGLSKFGQFRFEQSINMINTIYLLKNKVNEKVYVGQTWTSLPTRWRSGWGYIGSTHLYNAIQKYGSDQFYYETLMFCGTQETADYWEQYFIGTL